MINSEVSLEHIINLTNFHEQKFIEMKITISLHKLHKNQNKFSPALSAIAAISKTKNRKRVEKENKKRDDEQWKPEITRMKSRII